MLVPTCMVKTLEFSLALACVVLHHYSYDLTDLSTLMLCSGTYIGFVIILSGEIIGEVISMPADPYIDGWWCTIGGVLFGAAGALTLKWWRDVPPCERRSYAQAAAVCAIAEAALLTIDALFGLCAARAGHIGIDEGSEKPKPQKCTACRI